LDGKNIFGIHQGEGNNGIKYFFIHNPRIFPRTYPDGKNDSFGDTFKKRVFFHIIHNLERTYEGRIYPNNSEGTLEHVYQLPVNYFLI
jgi:hypothetical protein